MELRGSTESCSTSQIVTLVIRDRVLYEKAPPPPAPSNSGLYYTYFQTGKGTTQHLFCTSYILETSQAMAVVGRRAAAKAKGGLRHLGSVSRLRK